VKLIGPDGEPLRARYDMLSLKAGVLPRGMSTEILLAVIVANDVYTGMGVDLVLTSIVDGSHSRGSRHYQGDAIDLRTRNFPTDADAKTASDRIRERLGADYDVVLEGNHIHVEYDPKTPLGAA